MSVFFLIVWPKKVVTEQGEKAVLCEIGSFCGKSTISIGKALVKHDAGILYAIDWHEGSPSFPGFGTQEYQTTYPEYLDNLEKFGVKEKIRIIKKDRKIPLMMFRTRSTFSGLMDCMNMMA